MHSAMVICGGFLLLAATVALGRFGGISPMRAALLFIPVWFVGAAINMYIGVAYAGYTVTQELPIFVAVFGVPAVAALVLRYMLAR